MFHFPSELPTEDLLHCFLPLVDQVIDTHQRGLVAPLQGMEAIQVDGGRLWFEDRLATPPQLNWEAVANVTHSSQSAVQVVDQYSRETEVGGPQTKTTNLLIGATDRPIQWPVYLPEFVSWEAQVGHHDQLTDVFSLGMLLAALALDLDFRHADDLSSFVENRRNPFRLRRDLHPVIARAIIQMTELDRDQRADDLAVIRQSLHNYREQQVELELELESIPQFQHQDAQTKQATILTRLQQRLFEITRRNRLLHFRSTMQTLNLTNSSVPLTLHWDTIPPERIVTWSDEFHRQVASGKPVSLNQYLNFSEALYVTGLLDRIISEVRRDEKEYGMAQLRLVGCFLRWVNLKETPYQRYDSPLVLVPVKLTKKKGVRDSYFIQALSNEAEINPVVRFQFRELFGIELPETIDLSHTSMGDLYELLESRIRQSEPSVTLNDLARPQIELLHEKARRQLDAYRRRARLSGRGVRSFMELDYSYDPANYHPLGIKLFSTLVRSSHTKLRDIVATVPEAKRYVSSPMVDETPPGWSGANGRQADVKERSFFSRRDSADENPYVWEFDRCNVTLGNFKYQKMSLVRDYDSLLKDPQDCPAFAATFSLTPQPTLEESQPLSPLEQRFPVVACDPTQAEAIDYARTESSYIIQGPPGTGKSQTITNLIADFVARGKRILFVCEKRAAIDVVYLRLKQRGLSSLCSLIHDSQADKKAFVMDLKDTYEKYLAEFKKGVSAPERHGLSSLSGQLRQLQAMDEAMETATPVTGVSPRELILKLLEGGTPLAELAEVECKVSYQSWHEHRETLGQLSDWVQQHGGTPLGNRPLVHLTQSSIERTRASDWIRTTTRSLRNAVAKIAELLSQTAFPMDSLSSITELAAVVAFAQDLLQLNADDPARLLDPKSDRCELLLAAEAEIEGYDQKLVEARKVAAGWVDPLPPEEVDIALDQARRFSSSVFSFLSPAWWKLRRVLRKCYDFQRHKIAPTWVQVLEWLEAVHDCETRLDQANYYAGSTIGFRGDVRQLMSDIKSLREKQAPLPDDAIAFLIDTDVSPDQRQLRVQSLARCQQHLDTILASATDLLAIDLEATGLTELQTLLEQVDASLHELPAFQQPLRWLGSLPSDLSLFVRSSGISLADCERVIAAASLESAYQNSSELQAYNETLRRQLAAGLLAANEQWQDENSQLIRYRVCESFLEKIRKLHDDQAAVDRRWQKSYERGRRELLHEFGKQMRYKSIRDLVSGDTAEMTRDLKPVWLMSPLSVSDTLPLSPDLFDVVIFDEASQITLEEAVPSLARARQAIVVGDEKQLPPTDFFSAKRSEDDEQLHFDDDGEPLQYDLSSNSFLNHTAKNLNSVMLGWHYRSRSEPLISFSNWAFYRGRLLTVPDEQIGDFERGPLSVDEETDPASMTDELLRRPISFHRLADGVYAKRRNVAEAQYIALLVRELLARDEGKSVGVVAFSEAQQQAIETALDQLAADDNEFRERLDAEWEREEDDQFVGLLVKNLENIQGDERDIVILSVCYGVAADGKMRMNFGPINKSGGERRLNVAFSRAKHHMVVVSSIDHSQITNDYNRGANCLKNYLRYAAAISTGRAEVARTTLTEMSLHREEASVEKTGSTVLQQLKAALQDQGWIVDQHVGHSHFQCHLALRKPSDTIYRLGILIDADTPRGKADLLEREVMRPELLRAFGWKVETVLAKDWLHDRQGVLRRIAAQL